MVSLSLPTHFRDPVFFQSAGFSSLYSTPSAKREPLRAATDTTAAKNFFIDDSPIDFQGNFPPFGYEYSTFSHFFQEHNEKN
jgi:hypothetical protein